MSPSHWSFPLLAALLGVLVYLNALQGEFVYDDLSYVQKNPSVQGSVGIFDQSAPPQRKDLGLYRPMTILTYYWTYQVRGLDAFAFHLVNALLHAVVSALVVLVARHLGAASRTALLAGLFFAVHPIHVESVAWVVGRAEIMAALFALPAVIAYGKPADRHSYRGPCLAAVLYGLAAISKETALPLPALFLLLDLYRRDRAAPGRIALRLIPSAVVCAAVIIARYKILGQFGPDPTDDPFLGSVTALDRPLLALAVLGKSLACLCLPASLSIYYDPDRFVGTAPVLLGVTLLGGLLLALTFFHRRGQRMAVRAVLLFLVAMIPFLHLVPIGAIYADRFLYLPSAGFLIAVAVVLLPNDHRPTTARWILAGLLLLIFAGMTVNRNPAFRNTISLWEDAAEKDPEASFPRFQLGGIYAEAGILEYQSAARPGAVYCWYESLRLDPRHPFAAEAHLKLGEYYAGTTGDAEKAVEHYRAALRLAPWYIDAMLDLAVMHRSGLVSVSESRRLLNQVLGPWADARFAPDDRQRKIAESLLRELPEDD